MTKTSGLLDRIPTEAELIKLTLDRVERVAALRGTSAQNICRLIIKDNKLPDLLASGERSITLRTYETLHTGLAALEAEGSLEERQLREAEETIRLTQVKKESCITLGAQAPEGFSLKDCTYENQRGKDGQKGS